MTQQPTNSGRELAHRAGDGIDVSLYWNERTNRITVRVYDARADEAFELDVRSRELRNGQNRIRLQEQPFEILRMMLEHPGDVVTREELV